HRHQSSGGCRGHGQGSRGDRARCASALGGELREALGRSRRHGRRSPREHRRRVDSRDHAGGLARARARSDRAAHGRDRRELRHRLFRLGRSHAGAVAALTAALHRKGHAGFREEHVMTRRRGARFALAAVLIFALIGPGAGAWAPTPAPGGPITIGVPAPPTGPFATYARDIIDGARLYSDEVGGQLGRRKLEMVVEDYQTKPDVALTKIRKLVERDRAQAVVGLVLSAAALAVKDYVNAQKVP